jgi:hypothetical protein
MIGNPYAFESYYTQEKVFDISHISTIKDITIDFYQRGNFKDSFNALIPYKETNYSTLMERTFTHLEYEQAMSAAQVSSTALMNYFNLNETQVLKLMEPFGETEFNQFATLFIESFEVGAKLSPNLFMENITLYLGYDVNSFTEDETLMLYTPDSLTYHYTKNNEKNIYMRWIHKIGDNHYEILDDQEIDFNKCEIRWFKENIGYTPPEGEELDPYAG